MSLLKQNIIRKRQVNELLELKLELDNTREDKEYKVDTIKNNAVYAKVIGGQLPELYYQVIWKIYSKDESIWKLASTIIYLYKMISIFHKDYPKKPMATFPLLDPTPSMATLMVKPIVKPTTKQKRGRPAQAIKQNRKTLLWIFEPHKK